MIPCLYKATETEFDNNGIGKLADCTSCVVTEKRNGEYELSMTYPAEGIHASNIEEENIILAKPSDTAEPQPFRIYQVTKSMDGALEVAAQHISYQLNYITVSPCSAVTGTYDQVNAAFEALKKNATSDCPFTFETDIQSESYFGILEPVSLRSALGGVSGSVLDSFGGEYEWDRYTVRLWESRGSDNGVRIVYGKNLVDFSQEKSTEDTITGVHPYWIDSETGIVKEITGKVVTIADSGAAYEKIGLLDCSDEFETEPTEDQLVSAAESYLSSSTTTEPSIDISVDFAQLWGLPGYEDIAEAEHVALCDTVHVYVPDLNVELSMSVTETEYDALLERYNSLTLSTSKTSSRNSAIELTLATTSNVKSMIAMTDSSIRLSVYNRYETKEDLQANYPTTVEVQSMISLSEEGITLDYTKALTETSQTLQQTISDTADELQSNIDGVATDLATNYSKTTEIESMIDLSEQGITLDYTKLVNETSQTLQQTISDTADELQSNIDGVATNLETNYSKTTEIESMIDLSEQGITLDYSKLVTETSESIQKTISDTADDLQSSIDGVAADLSTNYSTTTEVESMIALSEEGITLDYTKLVNETSETIQKTISDTADDLQTSIDGVATDLNTNYSTTTEVQSMIDLSEQGITLDYTKLVNETSETIQKTISDTADDLQSSIDGVTTDLSTNYSTTTEVKSMISASESGITLDYTKLVNETSETIQKTISDTADDLQSSIDGVANDLSTNYSKTTEIESMISASEQGITLDYSKAIEEATTEINNTLTNDYYTATKVESLISASEQGITLDYTKAISDATTEINNTLTNNYSTTTEIKSLISASEDGITLSYEKAITDSLSDYSTTTEVKSLISASEDGIALSYVKNGTVRSQFALESGSATISSGVIKFSSNSITIDSSNFSLTTSGQVTATGSFTSGSDSSYKVVVSNGAITGYRYGTQVAQYTMNAATNFTDGGTDYGTLYGTTVTADYFKVTSTFIGLRSDFLGAYSYTSGGTDYYAIGKTGSLTVITGLTYSSLENVCRNLTSNGSGGYSWSNTTFSYISGYTTRSISFSDGLMTTTLGS